MQNLPSGSEYGKAIKKCVQAPKGWLFVGSDFSSLEARINALLTKDPNKLKVYTDGFDSHSFNAYSFWKEQMPDIQQATESEQCYEIRTSNKVYYVKATDTIIYKGNTYSGVKFYEMVTHQKL